MATSHIPGCIPKPNKLLIGLISTDSNVICKMDFMLEKRMATGAWVNRLLRLSVCRKWFVGIGLLL